MAALLTDSLLVALVQQLMESVGVEAVAVVQLCC
jgi:hypothetical protein